MKSGAWTKEGSVLDNDIRMLCFSSLQRYILSRETANPRATLGTRPVDAETHKHSLTNRIYDDSEVPLGARSFQTIVPFDLPFIPDIANATVVLVTRTVDSWTRNVAAVAR